jgi:hypothetical protein
MKETKRNKKTDETKKEGERRRNRKEKEERTEKSSVREMSQKPCRVSTLSSGRWYFPVFIEICNSRVSLYLFIYGLLKEAASCSDYMS